MEESIFIGCPTHLGLLDSGSARSIYATASRSMQVYGMVNGKSLLSGNCNTLWCSALNARQEYSVKWFAMLHADVEPDPWWVDTLIGIILENDLDMVSAVIPIKDEKGFTSTAVGEINERKARYRLTQSQVNHELFPKIFNVHDAIESLALLPGNLQITEQFENPVLLMNTGCFVCRLDRPWATRVWFSNDDWIEQMDDGVWRANDFSEDWKFSQLLARHGCRVAATTKLRCVHKGTGLFDSSKIWGRPNDLGHLIRKEVS